MGLLWLPLRNMSPKLDIEYERGQIYSFLFKVPMIRLVLLQYR